MKVAGYRLQDASCRFGFTNELWAGTAIYTEKEKTTMPNWLRALIAGYGAKKLGGGCISTILIFILLYWLLGQGGCNF